MPATNSREIVQSPLEVWVAPVNESRPDLSDDPAGNWVRLGTQGDRNISGEGVRMAFPQEINMFTGLGETVPLKAARTSEGPRISFNLHDVSLEALRYALNSATQTDVAEGAATAGLQRASVYRGTSVAELALLLRGDWSPYGDAFKSQWWFGRVIEMGQPELSFAKGVWSAVNFEFAVLWNSEASAGEEVGVAEQQDAAPTG